MILRSRRRVALCRCAALLLCLAVTICPVCQASARQTELGGGAADQKGPGGYRTAMFYYENDLFAGTDQYYTSAFKVTWLTKDLNAYGDALPGWLTPAAERAPFVRQSGTGLGVLHNVGFSFGQNIYTPDDTDHDTLISDDRPYAGWLYGAIALHRRTARRLDTFETTVGMVGPSSLGEQSQNEVHRIRHISEAQGWDHQLRDEPGIMFTWQQSRKPVVLELGQDFGLDCIPHVGATLGNVFTYVNLGGEVRLGYNLPSDFGTAVIRPGATLSAPTSGGEERGAGLHLFAGGDGRLVAQNIFLDGNTWKDSHSVDKVPFVADLYVGAALQYGRFKLTYTHAYRSKEFKGQDRGQLFGSVSLRYTF